jgi:hypothetical protein
MSYALVMIVKDARGSIEACLASAKPYIGYWSICDTGSTDGTQNLIRPVLGEIPGELYEDRWQNFGHNRSLALSRAHGTAEWLLLLDADMMVEIDEDFVPDPAVDAYTIEMGNSSGFSYRLPLLVRGDLPWRSIGAVHEYTSLPDRAYVGQPTDAVRVTVGPTPTSPSKRHWHAGMLEEELERDPGNARAVFYLAQTYREMGDPRARDLYLRRTKMGGFEEERWYALYRAALLAPWPGQAVELMAAWNTRPSRLEPLHALVSELNRRGLHWAAYALSAPVEPCADSLFVERNVWRWGMKFERSISAWWAGHRDESHVLCDELLADPLLPDHIRTAVERNRVL